MSEKIHKILERAQMPNGTKIQIEDWKEVYPTVEKTLNIAAYPKAKNSGWLIRKGESFRLALSRGFKDDDEVLETFERLKYGVVTLEDLVEHYRDDDSKYYMDIKE